MGYTWKWLSPGPFRIYRIISLLFCWFWSLYGRNYQSDFIEYKAIHPYARSYQGYSAQEMIRDK